MLYSQRSPGSAADGEGPDRLDVHLAAPGHERHQAGHPVIADVLLGRGVEPPDSHLRQTRTGRRHGSLPIVT